jgi:hypothetical protein
MQELKAVGSFFNERYAGGFVDASFNHNQVKFILSHFKHKLTTSYLHRSTFGPLTRTERWLVPKVF